MRLLSRHKRLYRLDDALRVADQVSVGVLRAQARSTVSPAGAPGAGFRGARGSWRRGRLGAQIFGEARIDAAFVQAFMLDDALRNSRVRLGDQGDGSLVGVSSSASAISRSRSRLAPRSRWSSCSARASRRLRRLTAGKCQPGVSARSALRMTATSMRFLRQSAGDRRQPAVRRGEHGQPRQAHADDDALQRDRPRPPRNDDRIGDPIEPVFKDDDVGGLGRCAGAARAHRDADIGGRKRRRVVDAVADHDGRVGVCSTATASTLSAGRDRPARHRDRAQRQSSRQRRRGHRSP